MGIVASAPQTRKCTGTTRVRCSKSFPLCVSVRVYLVSTMAATYISGRIVAPPCSMTCIYHNPRCSKSRAALSLLEARGIEPKVVHYLETPPDADTLRGIAAALGCSAGDLMRKGEALCRELGIADGAHDEDALFRLVVDNPVLLERPIVVHDGHAVIGRPPEAVLALFDR